MPRGVHRVGILQRVENAGAPCAEVRVNRGADGGEAEGARDGVDLNATKNRGGGSRVAEDADKEERTCRIDDGRACACWGGDGSTGSYRAGASDGERSDGAGRSVRNDEAAIERIKGHAGDEHSARGSDAR